MSIGKDFNNRVTWAHIVRSQYLQYLKAKNLIPEYEPKEVTKTRVNYVTNQILVNEYGFSWDEAKLAEKQYYEAGLDLLD